MARSTALLFTCEHGGNRVPKQYLAIFKGHNNRLESHRGYDPGALPLARCLAKELNAPLLFSTITRLLVELNRSPGNPSLFSDITKNAPDAVRESILSTYYMPYRTEVERKIEGLLTNHDRVLHVSVHTFTPVLHGQVRRMDVGLLYDPKRPGEKALCHRWQCLIHDIAPEYVVRRNAPYRGVSDGFTTHLRRRYSAARYLGIELEVNQRLAAGSPAQKIAITKLILNSLRAVIKGTTP
ncbi:MAG: hypothetical protein AMXMBFR84_36720 [Candidatus Hydrogenedentota bacterium]